MSLHQTIESMERSVCLPTNHRRFEAAKQYQSELRKYQNIEHALAILADADPASVQGREALLRSLLAIHQRNPHTFWSAALIVACKPILLRLRARLISSWEESTDLDQKVLTAFMETVRTFPLKRRKDRTYMYLRQMTQRRVFRELQKRHREARRFSLRGLQDLTQCQDRLQSEEIDKGADDSDMPWLHRPALDDAVVTFLLEHAQNIVGESQLQLLVATIGYGEKIAAYVGRQHPELRPEEQRRVYERVRRRRSRALIRLRKTMTELRPVA